MYKKLLSSILFINVILVIFIPVSLKASPDEDIWWDDKWSFRKEIQIPISTNNEYAHYQPIDFKMEFENPCWAKNEEEHSIRIIFQDSNRIIHLESQIYNLSFEEENKIKSCNIVFLIPEEANGKERYYVYYDHDKKSCPNYVNHVDIDESYYNYEPIPGIKFESYYYEIIQEGYSVYAVNYKGKALKYSVTQQVAKLKEKTKIVKPSTGELGVSFGFEYAWKKDGSWIDKFSSIENLVAHERIIDGNLMVKFGIVSQSNNGLVRSKVIYKYYYNPKEDKRIYSHVRHEVIGNSLPNGDEMEASYIILTNTRMRSNTIDELNFGFLPRYLNFYNEENNVNQYQLEQYPEGHKALKIIGKEDDCDLGNLSWVSVGDGITGRADAVIFESNNLSKSTTDELNGLELQLWETDYPRFPGVQGSSSVLYIERNEFDEGKIVNKPIPEGYYVEFDAEFFNTKTGGYKAVEEETKMYQKLIKLQSSEYEDFDDEEDKEIEKFNLTAYVHLAPSFPLGSILSLVLDKNLSYIFAELYKDNNFVSSASVSRLSLTKYTKADLSKMTVFEKIKKLIDLLDWKNFTIFKSKIFNEEPGRYLIKVYRENSITGDRQFIGYSIFNLYKDKEIDIYCKQEGKIDLSFFDQNNKGIENVKAFLKKDNTIIAESESNSNGIANIKAPCGLLKEGYTLNISYQGFLINEGNIKLGLINKFNPLKKSFNFDVYDLNISIKDSENSNPSFDVDFSLTSNEMKVPVVLYPEKVSNGSYIFKNLYPANYDLIIGYDSLKIKEKIKIPDKDSISIKLYNFSVLIKDNWNLSPGTNFDVTLKSTNFENNCLLTAKKSADGKYKFSNLYQGNYLLKICYKMFKLEKNFNIPYENTIITFPAVFNFTLEVLDSHGNPIKNAEVLINRSGEKINAFTNDSAVVTFLLPPGKYYYKIFLNGDLIAKRYVDVLNDKKNTVVTTAEPILTYVVIFLSTILIFVGLIYCIKRKNTKFFFKIFAISLVIIAIVSPWYAIYGKSYDQEIETSTKLYLIPSNMTKIIKNSNFTAGKLVPIEQENLKKKINLLFISFEVNFIFIISMIPKLLILGIVLIIFSIILNSYYKKNLYLLTLFIALLIFVASFIVFYYSMSLMADTLVGSFIGNGDLDILIPGEQKILTTLNDWGPSLGFYLLMLSIIVLTSMFCIDIYKTFIKKILKKNKNKKN